MDGEEKTPCLKCGKNDATETSVYCTGCIAARAAESPAPAIDISVIRGHQEVFGKAVDQLIVIYRDFDRTKRMEIKERLLKFYETLQELGGRLGVSRQSLDHLWEG